MLVTFDILIVPNAVTLPKFEINLYFYLGTDKNSEEYRIRMNLKILTNIMKRKAKEVKDIVILSHIIDKER